MLIYCKQLVNLYLHLLYFQKETQKKKLANQLIKYFPPKSIGRKYIR